ncbi:MAG: L-seryl-tRNA(Sec) selenium transferase, partial [Chloroflexi bacterium]|nr:L-seryl-tRNA(Sec) selenium transferase [Chloroflexota bacterium]
MEALRQVPSVDRVIREPEVASFRSAVGHEKVVSVVREVLAEVRRHARQGHPVPDLDALVEVVVQRLRVAVRPSLIPVINATGVIIHTNLGRAPLSASARDQVMAISRGYSNLEFDLEQGRRGARHVHAVALLRDILQVEDALVVNNNAGAVFLLLRTLAPGREVIISRGQLVEIGGSFRIPDILAESGAILREVGTTNRTHLADYARAVGENTALILRVHQSNFRQIGFTAQPPLRELVALAHAKGLPLVDDLGSGTFIDPRPFGLAYEPTVQESLAAGADVVTFSGDKLLGGPQAGIIVGRSAIIEHVRRHPLARALRVDKMTLAALEATLAAYRRGTALEEIPVWRMITAGLDTLHQRALRWQNHLAERDIPAQVVQSTSAVGGGALPGETLPTWALSLPSGRASRLAAQLRAGDPPIVARVVDDRVLLDPRTVLPEEED